MHNNVLLFKYRESSNKVWPPRWASAGGVNKNKIKIKITKVTELLQNWTQLSNQSINSQLKGNYESKFKMLR
jgi:hypothetical protein